jgi:hypothetical protein
MHEYPSLNLRRWRISRWAVTLSWHFVTGGSVFAITSLTAVRTVSAFITLYIDILKFTDSPKKEQTSEKYLDGKWINNGQTNGETDFRWETSVYITLIALFSLETFRTCAYPCNSIATYCRGLTIAWLFAVASVKPAFTG